MQSSFSCRTVVLEQRDAYLVPGAHFGAFAEEPVHHVKLIFPHGNYERRVAPLLWTEGTKKECHFTALLPTVAATVSPVVARDASAVSRRPVHAR